VKNPTQGYKLAIESIELDRYLHFQAMDCRKLLGREPSKEEIEYLTSGFRGGFKACIKTILEDTQKRLARQDEVMAGLLRVSREHACDHEYGDKGYYYWAELAKELLNAPTEQKEK